MTIQATHATAESVVKMTEDPVPSGCVLTTKTASPSFVEIRAALTDHPIRSSNQAAGKR